MNLDDAKLVKSDVDGWIKSVDQKVSILLAFTVAAMALVAKPIFIFFNSFFPLENVFGWVMLVEGCFLLAYSIIKCLHALIPRIKMPKLASSLIFFGSIASLKKAGDYKSKAMRMTKTAYKEDLLNQIHINSVISKKKYIQLFDAIILLIIGGAFIASAMVISWGEGLS